jgi:glycerate 2-kinase
MRVLIAPDKFKGSLTATEAARCIERALLAYMPSLAPVRKPVADGGEGTASVLTAATNGTIQEVVVNDPLYRQVSASYGISGNGKTAFVEMAQASGLDRLKPNERNPLLTTTFGTGELIRDAIKQGVEEVILCIGGSATTDAGMGMATVLGYEFLDKTGVPLRPIGQSMRHIDRIRRASLQIDLKKVRFRVACDVENPLFGPNGAAHIYGPQKGANPKMVAELDKGLRRIAHVLQRDFGIEEAEKPGSGAAGGLGFGARVFLKASFQNGFDLVADTLNLEQEIVNTNLIITGEGSLDEQTLEGKVIAGITRMAQVHGVPVVAFCGRSTLSPAQLETLGLAESMAITPTSMPLNEAMRQADTLLEQAVHEWAGRMLGQYTKK